MYKKDPAATLKYILTEAQANGIDLRSILGTNGGAIDTGAIASLIDKKLEPVLRPINDRNEASQRERKALDDATRETMQFFDSYPDAIVHEETLAKFITAKPHMKPVDLYYQLKDWASKNDLDWSQPLGPQLQARQGKQSQRQRRQPLPQGREQRRLVDSRDNDASFSPTARTDDIVREAMREAGLDV
jgi:hypothetical protein